MSGASFLCPVDPRSPHSSPRDCPHRVTTHTGQGSHGLRSPAAAKARSLSDGCEPPLKLTILMIAFMAAAKRQALPRHRLLSR